MLQNSAFSFSRFIPWLHVDCGFCFGGFFSPFLEVGCSVLASYMTGSYLKRAPWWVYPSSHSGTKGTDTCRDYHPGNDGACHPQNCGSASQPLMRTRSNVSGNYFASLWPQWQTLGLRAAPPWEQKTEEFCSVGWQGTVLCKHSQGLLQRFLWWDTTPPRTSLLRLARLPPRTKGESVFSSWVTFCNVITSREDNSHWVFKHNHPLY